MNNIIDRDLGGVYYEGNCTYNTRGVFLLQHKYN